MGGRRSDMSGPPTDERTLAAMLPEAARPKEK
jgi:hypothetical protein